MDEIKIDKKYTDFIENILKQISPLLPKDVNDLQKNYLIANVKKSATLMAQSMTETEEFIALDFETQTFLIQVIMEWSYHKEIDLFRSGIPAKYWKVVMQKIWYTTWEVMYACIKNNASKEVILSLVERFINRSYREAVEELKEQNIIDEEIEEKAKSQSNITLMAINMLTDKMRKDTIKNIFIKTIQFFIIGIIVSFVILHYKNNGLIIILTLILLYILSPIKQNK